MLTQSPPVARKPSIRDEAAEIVDDPDVWLDTPLDTLGGRAPRDFIGKPEEDVLRNLIHQIKHGMMS